MEIVYYAACATGGVLVPSPSGFFSSTGGVAGTEGTGAGGTLGSAAGTPGSAGLGAGTSFNGGASDVPGMFDGTAGPVGVGVPGCIGSFGWFGFI